MTKQEKIYIAREFRKKPTISEAMIWEGLRAKQFLNLKFRRQHLISGYIIDFYCSELNLAIEIDGPVHLRQIKEDAERQKNIEDLGIKFIRINSEDIEYDLKSVLKKIEIKIKKLIKK